MDKHCKCRVICKEPTSPAWRVSFPGGERLRMLQEQEDGTVRKEHLVWIYRRFIHWKHKCGLREDLHKDEAEVAGWAASRGLECPPQQPDSPYSSRLPIFSLSWGLLGNISNYQKVRWVCDNRVLTCLCQICFMFYFVCINTLIVVIFFTHLPYTLHVLFPLPEGSHYKVSVFTLEINPEYS